MSIEMDAASADDQTTVEDMASELGQAIAETPEHERFEETRRAVQESEEAQAKIEEFESTRQEFMLARQSGEATQEDLQELQGTQQELHSIPVMADFLEAQNELQARLEALDDAISTPLALDFGDNIGGCCND
ncbi:regulator [Halobacteriales archaeon QS_3_64_16]|nr:MAG: regulator [Halobacteriales archaeon QS_3_64_16]